MLLQEKNYIKLTIFTLNSTMFLQPENHRTMFLFQIRLFSYICSIPCPPGMTANSAQSQYTLLSNYRVAGLNKIQEG